MPSSGNPKQIHSIMEALYDAPLFPSRWEEFLGVILLGHGMKVVAMNAAAERILAARNGLKTAQKRLTCDDTRESAQLERLISDASLISQGKGTEVGNEMRISRRDLWPLKAVVSPVRGIDFGNDHRVQAVIFVTDPTTRVRPAQDTLRIAFGLTPAECRVALLLADGHAPQEIATMIGVTSNTVRSQIKSIYSKTGVRRQAELIRLLLAS